MHSFASVAASLVLFCIPSIAQYVPATGFELSLDYGTVVVWNGSTSLPVAKIQGSASYHDAMLAMVAAEATPRSATQKVLDQSRPEWFNKSMVNVSTQPLCSMLNALSAAAKHFLDRHDSSQIGLAIPFDEPLPQTWRSEVLDKALQCAGLPPPISTYTFAVETAARANGVGDCSRCQLCSIDNADTPEELFLAVQYGGSSLSAALMQTFYGQINTRRSEWSFELGHENLQHRVSDSAAYWVEVQRLLERVSTLPSPYPYDPKSITRVVLYGERTDSIAFQETLKRVLSKVVKIEVQTQQCQLLDPLFTAAEGSFNWAWNAKTFEVDA